MTALEKLKIEHPKLIDKRVNGGAIGCPHDYGYLPRHNHCENRDGTLCEKCWNREIPE